MTQPRTTAAVLLRMAADLTAVAAQLVEDVRDPAELVMLSEAAAEAKCSVRTLTDARRKGDLVMFGKQRSRAIKRADLTAWIASREVKPIAGVDDLAMRRRVERLATKRRAS